MYDKDKSAKVVYLIYDSVECEVVVSYRTHNFNSSKAIFSTLSSANKVLKQLNNSCGLSYYRYEIIQYRK